jgi:hypothetical protein
LKRKKKIKKKQLKIIFNRINDTFTFAN